MLYIILKAETRRWYTGNMQPQSSSGFREIEHTADWELEIWAPDLPGLLEQAAMGMYQLTGVKLVSQPRKFKQISLNNSDPETLLVDFLNELLFYAESEGLAFDHFELKMEGDQMEARVDGAPIASMGKEIKATTYHNLSIIENKQKLTAKIVFDV